MNCHDKVLIIKEVIYKLLKLISEFIKLLDTRAIYKNLVYFYMSSTNK